MRTRTFNVPADLMIDFAGEIVDNSLTATIEGFDDEEDEITLEIEYESDQRDIMHSLQDMIDDYHEEQEEGDDDD